MKTKTLGLFAIPVIAAIMIGAGASTQLAIAYPDGSNPQSAFISRDFGCGMFDGNGDFVLATDGTLSVVTHGQTAILKCQVFGVPNDTGDAVVTTGFNCGTFLGPTTNSRNVVSEDGNATLICKVNNAAQNP